MRLTETRNGISGLGWATLGSTVSTQGSPNIFIYAADSESQINLAGICGGACVSVCLQPAVLLLFPVAVGGWLFQILWCS